MEEFIRVLTEQIRCVKARDGVAKELMDHIQDQAECYEESGMSQEEAMQAAVKEMGDPVAIGMELDHIHRPKTDWKMLLMVVIFSIVGFVIQYITGVFDSSTDRFWNQCFFIVIGLAAMFGIYFLDYSFIGKYAKWLFWGMMLFLIIYTNSFAAQINGQARGMVMPAYLLIPIYAGILYQHRGMRYVGIVKSILYIIPPVWFCLTMIPSVPAMVNISFIMYCMLMLAVWKNWFGINRKRTVIILFLVGFVLPLVYVFFSYHFIMREFQRMRIQSFVHSFLGAKEYETSYSYNAIRSLIADCEWIGYTANVEGSYMLTQDHGFIITQLITSYGMAIGCVVIVAFFMFISHIFHITQKQKNQLGYMIGSGCGMIFLVMVMEGIFMNLGFFPSTTIYIPFLTYGSAATVGYAILIGLLLSVYRYQNILSDKAFKPKWKLSLKIEKAMKE